MNNPSLFAKVREACYLSRHHACTALCTYDSFSTHSRPHFLSFFIHIQTVIRLSNFQAKSSQHPIAVFISPTRDKTPSNWFALQEQAPLNGRLSFLLASDLDDACRGVCEAISLLGDDAKRQAQNRYYASLLSGATSSEAAEDVGRELFLNCLRLNDEKELWRVLAVYGQMNALAGAGRDQLLKECPIERATAECLTEFLDGLGE